MNPQILKYKKQIFNLKKKIAAIQDSCPHTNNKAKYESSTGGYDPSNDCWWIVVNCLDCGKYMRFDSVRDAEMYRDKRWKIKR